MNTQSKGSAVIDRSDLERALARVAVAAFTYYPGKELEEPGYVVDEDVQWAMEPMGVLANEQQAEWRDRFTAVIADPTVDRRKFLSDLMALANE